MVMRILAIDYGLARIGLAMSDPTGILAQAYGVLSRRNDILAVQDIADVVSKESVDVIVVGHPITLKGERGDRAIAAEEFAAAIRDKTGKDVLMHDERLTTRQAERVLIEGDVRRQKRKQVIDAMAATLLLQSYLDARRR